MSLNGLLAYAQQQQRLFNEDISVALRSMEQGETLLPMVSLIIAGFLYGLFHAIGPGHGKMIISGYMLAGKRNARDAWQLSALAALMQAITAIVLVLGAFYLLDISKSAVEELVGNLVTVSGIMVAAIGVLLFLRGLRDLLGLSKKHSCCGHDHGVTPSMLATTGSWKEKLTMIISIGIRPCSGAIILLFFSCMLGLAWSGVLATFAMALGTAIATFTLAWITVRSKDGLVKLVGNSEKKLRIAQSVCSMIAGAVILLSGMLLIAVLSGTPNDATDTLSISTGNHPLFHKP